MPGVVRSLGSVPLSYYTSNRPLFFFSISFAVVFCLCLPLQLAHQHSTVRSAHHTCASSLIPLRFAVLGSLSFSFFFSCATITVADIPKAFVLFRSLMYLNTHVSMRCKNDIRCGISQQLIDASLRDCPNWNCKRVLEYHCMQSILVLWKIFCDSRHISKPFIE